MSSLSSPQYNVACRGATAMLHLVALSVLLATSPLHASDDDPHAAHRQHMQNAAGASATQIHLPNTQLVDAHGNAYPFNDTAFGDRVVVIDFVYTTCTTICPVLSATMAAVQRQLADRLGDEVALVSVSVDPSHDTPARLNDYAKRFKAGDDWHWLTGNRGQVNRVLRAFGLTPGAPEDHPPVILVGKPADNQWLRWVGIPSADSVVRETQALLDDHTAAAIKHVASFTAQHSEAR